MITITINPHPLPIPHSSCCVNQQKTLMSITIKQVQGILMKICCLFGPISKVAVVYHMPISERVKALNISNCTFITALIICSE